MDARVVVSAYLIAQAVGTAAWWMLLVLEPRSLAWFQPSGPYRFVRNPMAVAGIAQGIAVGWLLGSPAVLAYTLAGAFFWHLLVRPVEEQDLQERFGPAYEEYRKSTGLWIPKPHSGGRG